MQRGLLVEFSCNSPTCYLIAHWRALLVVRSFVLEWRVVATTIHSMKTAIILNLCEIWILLWKLCTSKIYYFDIQPWKHQFPESFCKLSLWHLQHMPWNWFSIPNHMHDHSQAWVELFNLLVTSSRIKIIYRHLDDCSVFFQNRESGFYLHYKNIAMYIW